MTIIECKIYVKKDFYHEHTYFIKDYGVATLSTLYLTASWIIIKFEIDITILTCLNQNYSLHKPGFKKYWIFLIIY